MKAATKIAVDAEIWILEAEDVVPDFAPGAALFDTVGAGASDVVAESVAIETGPTEGAGPILATSELVKKNMHFRKLSQYLERLRTDIVKMTPG